MLNRLVCELSWARFSPPDQDSLHPESSAHYTPELLRHSHQWEQLRGTIASETESRMNPEISGNTICKKAVLSGAGTYEREGSYHLTRNPSNRLF